MPEKHPKELPSLFLTEMWERFSFYLMLGLLTLYMITDPVMGGLGFSKAHASTIFGTYIALVYLTPFIGGILADRILGYRKAIILGAVLMCAGHVSLAFESPACFYLGLILLIAGNGFFKPNISTLLGRLYPEGSKLRDDGFSIFYLGINLGAFFCNFVAAILRNKYGWHAAFGSAGVGMAIGLVIFLSVYKRLGRAEIDTSKARTDGRGDEGLSDLVILVLPSSLALALGAYWLWGVTGAFFAACLPVVLFYIQLWHKASSEEKGPFGAICAISVVLVPFWMVFNLYGTVMTFWAEENTVRRVESQTVVDFLQTVDLLQLAPPRYFHNASPDVPRPHKEWLVVVRGTDDEIEREKAFYADRLGQTDPPVPAEERYRRVGPVPVTQAEFDAIYRNAGAAVLPKGKTLKLINTELFQSVNPFWVMALTPVVVGFWGFLRRRKREPSTPAKIGIGILFGVAYMLTMLVAVLVSGDGATKQSALWLIGAYAVVTVGELWLSPVGLSLVAKLAPKRLGAVMMGGFFMSIAIGNKLSGVIGGMWEKASHTSFFIILALILLVFAAGIFAMTPWLKKYMPAERDAA